MAIEIKPIDLGEITDLQGKYLVVDTKSDGYTGTVNGRYNHEVVYAGGEYQVYPTLWDNELSEFVRQDYQVVNTLGDKVNYVASTTSDPYNHAVIATLQVAPGTEKEQAVAYAFKLYADSRFSLGNYNLFIAGGVLVGDDPEFTDVTGVKLDKSSGNLFVGDTVELTATVEPTNATVKKVTFTSSDSTIASVTQSGAKATVTAKKAGSATITVTTENQEKTATYKATITLFVAVTGVTLNKTETAIEIGATDTLVATIAPSNATNKAVTFSTGDKAIATVDSKGVVTGVSAGTATITVKSTDGAKTATCTVTVNAPEPEVPEE